MKKRNTEYLQLLRDPRWQKKRLEIMQRDEFSCQSCGDCESTLNVHHCYYAKGKKPWEYPNLSLVTLCEECHRQETELGYGEKQALIQAFCMKGLLSAHFNDLACSVYEADFGVRTSSLEPIIAYISYAIRTPRILDLLADEFHRDMKERREKRQQEKAAHEIP